MRPGDTLFLKVVSTLRDSSAGGLGRMPLQLEDTTLPLQLFLKRTWDVTMPWDE